ncbi:RNA-directed DNA polymerase, eukaryota, reverse transcriptase zinc-binding domain protein [Tanacetum coccineum]
MGDADINVLTMEQYMALTRRNQAQGVVKPEIGGNVNFEIKSQFMRELREDTFSRNKNDDSKEHVERISDIVSLFNILGVTHDAIMLRVFPITLTEAAKRWVGRLSPGTIDTWDLLKKAFIQRYCSPSKMAKQLEEIHNFKQDSDEILYQAWESLGRDMKKMKENVHAIQVVCGNCGGAHLNKECPLNEEVNNGNGARYHIEQLAKDYQAKAANEVPNPSVGQYKVIFANNEASSDEASSKGTVEFHEVSFTSDDNVQVPRKRRKGHKEYLGASVNIMPKFMLNHLKLTNFKETNMLVEMADMTKKVPVRIVENVLVKIDKFLFPSDFIIIDMLGDPNETMILGRPFLATIHARIDVFYKEISLGVGDDRIVFDMNGKVHHPVILVENVCMINEVQGEESFNPPEIGNDLFSYESLLKITKEKKGMTNIAEPETTTLRLHYSKRLQEMDDPDITIEEYIRLETEKDLRKAIVYNDPLTSELELSCEPTVSPQHIDKVNWKIEISFSDSDDDNYTVIYDNYLFSYKIFNVDDLKLDMGNDDDKIDIKQSSGDLSIKPLPNESMDVGAERQGNWTSKMMKLCCQVITMG